MPRSMRPAIAVHGGAGTWHPERSQSGLEGVKRSAQAGFDLMKNGSNALDAVTEAVALMEDNGAFNAGYGSSLSIDRQVEMEASIMNGKTLQAGAVGLLHDIRNPVRLARIVMEKTDHVFLVGKGAERLAKLCNVERRTPVTEFKLKRYEDQMKLMREGKSELPKLADLVKSHPELFELGTVGAVAIDRTGSVAAATSTGGFALKMPGRIGDSPLIGCGTYADDEAGACSATGVGEIAIRLVLAKTVCNYMKSGRNAQDAAESAIELVNDKLGNCYNSMGLISIDLDGNVGGAHNSPNMCWAYMTQESKTTFSSLTARIVK